MVKRANKGKDMSDGTAFAAILLISSLALIVIAVLVTASTNA